MQQKGDESDSEIHLKKSSVKVADDAVNEGNKKLQQALKKHIFTRDSLLFTTQFSE